MAIGNKAPGRESPCDISTDRKRVAGRRRQKVNPVAQEMHRSAQAFKDAITEVSNSRANVKREVRGR